MINMLFYKYVLFNIQKKGLDGRIIFELLVYICFVNFRFSNMFVRILIIKKNEKYKFLYKKLNWKCNCLDGCDYLFNVCKWRVLYKYNIYRKIFEFKI